MVATQSKPESRSEPRIDPSAQIHSYANIIGDVFIGATAAIASGTSIRADVGRPFYLSVGAKVQDGAMIRGLERGRVVGDDGQEYSVWIGENAAVMHMALVYGPAYLGENCFVGFRSTVFNSRIGDRTVIAMHALVQDVEIAPGKYVPSGAIIVTQAQADRLENVQPEHLVLVQHLAGSLVGSLADASSVSSSQNLFQNLQVEVVGELPQALNSLTKSSVIRSPINGVKNMQAQQITTDYVQQVRQLLAQGYRVGAEYADERRYRTSSWQSCTGISEASHESSVLSAIQACLKEHQGGYVRLVGIDTKVKRRISEVIIQRPGDLPSTQPSSSSYSSSGYNNANASPALSNGKLSSEAIAQVRNLLAAGYKIGTEHADERRFRTSSWHSCSPIQATNESSAISGLEACLAEHNGEYVRLLGIDSKNKRRVLEMILQRPGQNSAQDSTQTSSHFSQSHNPGNNGNYASSSGNIASETVTQVRQLLAQGYRVGAEHADQRRFRTSSWHSCTPIQSNSESEVIVGLETCLREHPGEYVRLIGIDPKSKRRIVEVIIQRPGSKAANSSTAVQASTQSGNNFTSQSSSPQVNHQGSKIKSDTLSQIRQLLMSGHRVSAEFADERRFRTSSWHSCPPISGNTEVGVASALESCLNEHPGEYVRLIGVDTKSKRRVLETIVQRP